MFKNTILFCLFFYGYTAALAQDKIGFGASTMYNFPIKTIGFGLRSQIPLSNRVLLVPNVRYAPAFNQIHEIYAGLNVHLVLISSQRKIAYTRSLPNPKKPNLYLKAGVDYNKWFNYIINVNPNAKEENILPQVGLGTSFGSLSMRFFAEAKYNVRWNEAFAEAGILLYPAFMKQKRKENCPVIK